MGKNALSWGVSGAIGGGLGSVVGGVTSLSKVASKPILNYVTDTVGETAVDTISNAAQGGRITPGSIVSSLAINAATEGISSNTVKKTTNTDDTLKLDLQHFAEKKVDFYVDPSGTARTPQHQQVQNIIQGLPDTTIAGSTITNYDSSGGYDAALKDFDSIGLNNIKDFVMAKEAGVGKVGYMDDGTNVTARSNSTSTNGPTLDIQYDDGPITDRNIKVRYY